MATTVFTIVPDDTSPLAAPLRIELTTEGDGSGSFRTNARACGVERASQEELVIECIASLLLSLATRGIAINTDAFRQATSDALNTMLASLHPHPADGPLCTEENPHGLRHPGIPESAWAEADEYGLLTATISLGDLRLKVTAIPVTVGVPVQHAVSDEHAALLDQLTDAFCPDGPWNTVQIHGRSYAVFAELYP